MSTLDFDFGKTDFFVLFLHGKDAFIFNFHFLEDVHQRIEIQFQ